MTIKELLTSYGLNETQISAVDTEVAKMQGIPKSRLDDEIRKKQEAVARTSELEAELEQANSKLTATTASVTELNTFKAKWEAGEAQRLETLKSEHTKLMSNIIDVKETDKSYDKVQKIKSLFTIKEDGTYTAEEMAANKKAYKPLELTDYFGTVATPAPDVVPPATPTPKTDKLGSIADMMNPNKNK